MLAQGQKAFQRGEYQRALALLDSAETYDPKTPAISFNRARVYTALNKLNAAQKAYKKAIQLDPSYPEAHLRMGDLAYQVGNLVKALRLFREEAKVAPTSPLYVRIGRAYAKLGKTDSALVAYEKAISMDSANANAHMAYGQLLQETGDLKAALAHSRKALSLQPDRPNYQFAVGSQLRQLGRLEEAASYLKRAADGRLLHYPAQYQLGQVFMRLGREEEAKHYLARADSSRRLMNQIISTQRAASSEPRVVEHWTRLGALFRKAEEPGQALQAFKKAAALQPENFSVQNSLAEIMLAEGRTKEAIRRFRAILTADRTQVDVWINLGLAYAIAGNCDEARRAWKTALEQRPGDTTATEYLSGLCQYTSQ